MEKEAPFQVGAMKWLEDREKKRQAQIGTSGPAYPFRTMGGAGKQVTFAAPSDSGPPLFQPHFGYGFRPPIFQQPGQPLVVYQDEGNRLRLPDGREVMVLPKSGDPTQTGNSGWQGPASPRMGGALQPIDGNARTSRKENRPTQDPHQGANWQGSPPQGRGSRPGENWGRSNDGNDRRSDQGWNNDRRSDQGWNDQNAGGGNWDSGNNRGPGPSNAGGGWNSGNDQGAGWNSGNDQRGGWTSGNDQGGGWNSGNDQGGDNWNSGDNQGGWNNDNQGGNNDNWPGNQNPSANWGTGNGSGNRGQNYGQMNSWGQNTQSPFGPPGGPPNDRNRNAISGPNQYWGGGGPSSPNQNDGW